MGALVLEATALTFVGGGIGIGVGVGLVELLAFVQSKVDNEAMQFLGQPTFSLPVALITVLLLGTLGWRPATSRHGGRSRYTRRRCCATSEDGHVR